METIIPILGDIGAAAVFIAAVVYVYFWPEKRCPKCETALVQVTDPGTNVTKEGCPTCGEYRNI